MEDFTLYDFVDCFIADSTKFKVTFDNDGVNTFRGTPKDFYNKRNKMKDDYLGDEDVDWQDFYESYVYDVRCDNGWLSIYVTYEPYRYNGY